VSDNNAGSLPPGNGRPGVAAGAGLKVLADLFCADKKLKSPIDRDFAGVCGSIWIEAASVEKDTGTLDVEKAGAAGLLKEKGCELTGCADGARFAAEVDGKPKLKSLLAGVDPD